MTRPATLIEDRIREGASGTGIALAAFVTGGYPDRERSPFLISALSEAADIVEVGVPFSDPLADGITIQRSSRQALEGGATLEWILEMLRNVSLDAPVTLMSYLNPLLSFPGTDLIRELAAAGVAGLIVPDLPFERSSALRSALDERGMALVQMVTPFTDPERTKQICNAARGFVYAVTSSGTTGGSLEIASGVLSYLDRVREDSPVPVMAGFGIRAREQVGQLTGHADGVIVGSALIEVVDQKGDPARFLRSLRTPEPSRAS